MIAPALLFALFSAAPEPLGSAMVTVDIVVPGAGHLIAGSKARIPIELLIRDGGGPLRIKTASVRTSLGKVSDVSIVGPGRVLLYYSPPDRIKKSSEMLDLALTKESGEEVRHAQPIEIANPDPPKVTLFLDPKKFNAGTPEVVKLRADASKADQLVIEAANGKLDLGSESRSEQSVGVSGSYTPPPDLPPDAPSHLLFLAAASGPRGFSGAAGGVSAIAPVRVSAEIPAGWALTLEGSEKTPDPVIGKGDGRTVIEGLVRYGAAIRAFAVQKKQKKEVPISLTTGVVPVALAVPIPGQNIADGGTGATILVAVPPSPFGGEVIWPELTVEGAKLIDEVRVTADVHALVIERPKTLQSVTVLGDGTAIATIPFGAAHGELVELSGLPAKQGERGAISILVRDVFGALTDTPLPRVRFEDGGELQLDRVRTGEYRAAIPSSTPGETGERRVVIAELEPPKALSADAQEFARGTLSVLLEGPPPAIRSEPDPIAAPVVSEEEPPFRIGLAGLAAAGTTFNGQLVLGGGFILESRLPVWENRILFRAGAEFFRASGPVELAVGATPVDGTFSVGGAVFPIEAGVVLVATGDFELGLRGGLELRTETGAVDAGADTVGGGSRFAASGRGTTEAAFSLGDAGSITAGVTVGGLGASTAGFAGGELDALEGNLLYVRLDLGFRFWL